MSDSVCLGQNSYLADLNQLRDQKNCSLEAKTCYSRTRFQRTFFTKDVRRKSRGWLSARVQNLLLLGLLEQSFTVLSQYCHPKQFEDGFNNARYTLKEMLAQNFTGNILWGAVV